MKILKNTFVGFLITLILYIVMTVILAGILFFTGFKEDWTYIGMIVILVIVSMAFGYIEGRLIGKKGFFVGIGTSMVFVAFILSTTSIIFDIEIIENLNPSLSFSLLSGAIGGILGTNSNK